MENGKPVYEFLGYKLKNAVYHRKIDGKLVSFSLQVPDENFDESSAIYSLKIIITLSFDGNEKTFFEFSSGFKINEIEWYKTFDVTNIRKSFFGSAVFPFIREKINNITDDSRGSIMLPIIDLRNVNLKEGIVLTPRY
jgi:preprotein translocase subunit SecB